MIGRVCGSAAGVFCPKVSTPDLHQVFLVTLSTLQHEPESISPLETLPAGDRVKWRHRNNLSFWLTARYSPGGYSPGGYKQSSAWGLFFHESLFLLRTRPLSSTGMNHDYGRADGRCLLDQRDFLAGEPPDQRVLEEITSAEGVPCWQLKTW